MGIINVDSVVRSIVVQSLLHIGSRSFSHLLNAIERYLPLLRSIAGSPSSGSASSTNTAEAKADILAATAAFWKYNPHMVGIVFDKLMQYQIVDPTDVIGWAFTRGSNEGKTGSRMSLAALEWDLLKGALDKANGRVTISRKKAAALRKEDDEKKARAKASGGADMEVDTDEKPGANTLGHLVAKIKLYLDTTPVVDNPALLTALKAFASLTREQKAALSRALEGFVSCLAPSPDDDRANRYVRTVIDDSQWRDRADWTDSHWSAWETWGWYRHFCRLVCHFVL
jgi:nuclear cap-binding protein subunit 1